MWFSPLKGAHLTLGQLDKTLPVEKSGDNLKIERGSFVYIHATANADGTGAAVSPRFALYKSAQAAKPNAVPYIALMGVKDFQAGMAGNVGQVETPISDDLVPPDGVGAAPTGDTLTFLGKKFTEGHQDFTGPRITAISVVQPAEYQTTAFDATKSYYVGEPLTINDEGKLTPFTSGNNIVGYVTATPFVRWINDLGASSDGARISGGNAKVINFSTAWIPVAATSDSTTEDGNGGSTTTPGNAQPLNVDAPKVAAAAPVKPATAAAAPAKAADPAKAAAPAANAPQGK